MNSNEAPPSQGLVGGKYQLVRMIGRGGMGSVWEARHVSLGTASAIKFIESEYADSQEARSRFDKEAKAAATIQSKHAIQVYDHGVTDDGKPYIVMELLQGEPLDKRIERRRQLSLPETARILQQVCRGLARAHERGIVHRDLKPENIFIVRTPDDDEEVAKVLDFGIAKMSSSPGNPGMTSSTKTGAVLGTPFYMSPEQARGLRNVDHRTDVWSLGVIAFKCVTGRLPFDGESIGDLLVKICTAPIPAPSQLVPGLPPGFDAWFLRALDRDPERRFPNVIELSDALCFVAGIATRSQQHGAPFSDMTVASAGGGATTPQGVMAPSAAGANHAHAARTPSPFGASGTPQPAAMTNAPFTSERSPGVPSGSGKLVAAVVAVVALTLGAGGVLLFARMRRPHADTTSGLVATPPTASPAAAPPSSESPVAKAAPDAQTATATATASATASATSTTAAAAHTAKAPPSPPKGTASKATSNATAANPPLPSTGAATATTPTPTATAKKKANKDDPGY
jgi:serine/threonine-protein kinase